jgi:hypothetical protein
LTIVVGDHELQANQANQPIQVSVSGGDPVQGLNCRVQVADGGPPAGGSDNGPAIQDLDILTGTIFDGNNTGTADVDGPHPDAWPMGEIRSTITVSGTVAAQGLLATIVMDTTGFYRGSWPLFLSDTRDGPTDFPGLQESLEIADGTIRIRGTQPPPPTIPEPSTLVLVSLGVVGLARLRRRASRRP